MVINPTKYTIFISKIIRTPMFENFLRWLFSYEWQLIPFWHETFCGWKWGPCSRQANAYIYRILITENQLSNYQMLLQVPKLVIWLGLIQLLISERAFIIISIVIIFYYFEEIISNCFKTFSCIGSKNWQILKTLYSRLTVY